jgi:prepilin-type N-terminal cleavage/methylation domain-containing protein
VIRDQEKSIFRRGRGLVTCQSQITDHKSRLLGFTLVELLIVLALIATLLTIALPRYFGSLERSKEAALKQTLAATRDAIDKFFTDTGKYPDSLPELVDKRYLRSLPVDPITESTTTWTIVPAPQESATRGEIKGEVYDVRSGAEGKASDGKPYAEF